MGKWLVVALALAVSTTAVADPVQPPQPASTAAATSAAKPKEKLICKTEEVVGSRLATRRTCLTALQWADRKLEDQQFVGKAQTQGFTNGH